jgi:NAD(P)-dependent dehydrogenase (short-subunit alcohol dehydrogenase family)
MQSADAGSAGNSPMRDPPSDPERGLLAGRVALVTGGARGIGRSIAARFAGAGAVGLVIDLPGTSSSPPDGWTALGADVRDETSLRAAVEATVGRFGRLDIVVANAGLVPPWAEMEAIDLALWDEIFAVNVRGVAATIKCAVPAMKQAGGAIVVTGSIMSYRAAAGQCLYAASKHAVLGIVRVAALDLGRHGIRVNAVGPGPIATEALQGRVARRAAAGGLPADEAFRQFAAQTALGRIATDADVAGAALFLASDLSAGMTGTILPVDGGLA